jgi:hypothetical protein
MKTRETLAVAIGAIGLAFALFLTLFQLVREDLAILGVPIIGTVVWREYVFTGMRMELAKLRRGAPQNSN